MIAHEIPQEVGDFAILLDSGYGRLNALLFNGLSAITTRPGVTTRPGAVLAYFWLAEIRAVVPYIQALSAASFTYIATAGLISGSHRQMTLAAGLRPFMLLLAGIGTTSPFHFGH